MTNYTDITILLDRSGSMSSIKNAMEEGFDAFIEQHKETPSTKVSLVEFDSDFALLSMQYPYTAIPVADVPKLKLEPRGGTPLVDALVRTIDTTGKRLASMIEQDRPAGVVFVIITDGEENSSRIYTRANAFDRLTHQRNVYNWQFIFLGANQDAIREAATLGIFANDSLTYRSTTNSVGNMFKAAASKIGTYTMGVSTSGHTVMPTFTNADREDAEQ